MLAAVLLRIWGLGEPSLWDDEIVTIRYAERSPGAIVGISAFIDVNPPLYYVVLHFWEKLTGTGEIAWRGLSALLGILTVPLAFLLGRRLLNNRAALAAAWFMAISPQHIYSSREARSQTMLALLVMLAAWALANLEARGRIRTALLASVPTALALWTHYYALFFVAAWICYGLYRGLAKKWDRRMLKRGLLYLGCTGLLFAPGFLILLIQLQGGQGWRPPQSVAYVLSAWGLSQSSGFLPWKISMLVAGRGAGPSGHQSHLLILALLLSLPPLLVALYGIKKLGKGDVPNEAGFIAWWALVPLALVLLACLKTPLFDPRHTLLCLPATAMLFGLGAYHLLTKSGLQRAAALGLLAWSILISMVAYANLRATEACQRQDWRGLAYEVAIDAEPGDVAFAHMELAALAFDYYNQDRVPLHTVFEWFPRPDHIEENPLAMTPQQRENRIRQAVRQIYPAQRIWFIDYHGGAFDPDGLARDLLAQSYVPIRSRYDMHGAYRYGMLLLSRKPQDVALALKPRVRFQDFDGPKLQLDQGWFETDEWTWTAGRACVLLPDREAAGRLTAEVYVPYELLGNSPVNLRFFTGGSESTYTINGPEVLNLQLDVHNADAQKPWLELCIESDRSFVPENDETGVAKSLLVKSIGWENH